MLLTIYYVIIQKTMPPRKSEVDVTIKFCQSEAVVRRYSLKCYQKFRKFYWQTPVLESLFNEV